MYDEYYRLFDNVYLIERNSIFNCSRNENYRRFGCKSVLICLTIHENNRSYKALARASRQSLA